MVSDHRSKPHYIQHLVGRSDWDKIAGRPGANYRAASLDVVGFIHCSRGPQILAPANTLYRGRDDMVMLLIDVDAVPSPVVYEDCYESGEQFPHVYGPIPVAAVVDVIDFPCEPDGSFQLPDALTENRSFRTEEA